MDIMIPDFLFNSQCVINRAVDTVTKGVVARTYMSDEPVDCGFMVDAESEAANYGRSAELNSYTVWLTDGTQVSKKDTITISGLTLDIVYVDPVQFRQNHVWLKAVEVR